MVRHVVWDWNGTLLADQQAVLGALNTLLRGMDRPAVDMATYRRLYTRPVRRFYEQLLDQVIDDVQWGHIDEVFHRAYGRQVREAALDPQARDVLAVVTSAGVSQSLLSMAPHDHLVSMVSHHDLDNHFVRVDGVRGMGGGHKEEWLRAHLERLDVTDPGEVVVIGDAMDDAVAAAAVGAPAVLFDGGSHEAEDLRGLDVPVVDSLARAVAVAGIA